MPATVLLHGERPAAVEPPRAERARLVPRNLPAERPQHEAVRAVDAGIAQRARIADERADQPGRGRLSEHPRQVAELGELRLLVANDAGGAAAVRRPQQNGGSQDGRDHTGITPHGEPKFPREASR